MKAYADSSFLVSLYLRDNHTGKAIGWMKQRTETLPFTQLHRHELRNAIRLAVWRKQLECAGRREAFRLLDSDVRDGFLTHQPVNWSEAFREAERLGEIQTESSGVRAADLLHLGVASLLGTSEFLTFDAIQRKAAVAAGLRCEI